jgi:hypothetical protein
MRIRKQQFFADILHDRRVQPELYHYVVQQDGSNVILSWSQEYTEEAAIRSAEGELDRLVDEEKREAS